MEWSNVTIKNIETKYEGKPGSLLSKAVYKAITLYENQDYKGSLKAAKKILWFAKTDMDKFWGHHLIAQSLWGMDDNDKAALEAIKALEYCVNYYGSNREIFLCYSELGVYYAKKEMFEKAMEVWKEGFKFASTNIEQCGYYRNMGRLYNDREDFQNAFKMGQFALQYAESNVEIADCYFIMAYSEFNLSEFDLESHSQEAIKYSRLCVEYIEKILSDNQEDDSSQSIQYWRKIALLCCHMLCTIYSECGEEDKAKEEAKHALKYTDGDREHEKDIYISLVCDDIGKKDVDVTKNLKVLLCYFDTRKEKYGVCSQFIKECEKCGNMQNAFKIAQCALHYAETDAEFATCYYGFVECQCKLKLEGYEREVIENAKICLKYVERIVPSSEDEKLLWREIKSRCYGLLAFRYMDIGEKDRAIENANYALEYIDSDRESEKAMYEIIAQCYEGRKDGSAIEPLRMLLRYYDTDEEKAFVHDRLSDEYVDINDWVKAAEEYEEIVKLNSDKKNIMMLLGFYSINGSTQLGKDLILKYGLRKDDPELLDFVRDDPELNKYLK